MNSKIFRSSFLTSMLVLLATLALITGVLFDYFELQLQNELKSEASYISYAVKDEGPSYIDNFKSSEKRITLIDKDGTVLADTSADAAALGNHADREEVKQAFESGSGTSVRYSDTLTQKTVYYAVLLEDGTVLRVSAVRHSVLTILMGLVYPVIIILMVALILSLILSSRVSKSIINPLNNLDLNNPENNETYEELTPLLKKISAQKHQIDNQLKAAEHKQEEFRLITENMTEGFLVIDEKTNLLTYNTAALKLLGIEEIQKGSVLLVNRTKGFREVIEKVLKGERAVNALETENRTYTLIANPVCEDGKVIGAVIVILDVTEQTNREKLRSEFTTNVSHELKTPLTSISGFAEMMMAGGMPEETVLDFSKSIYDEAQRLISLVGDIIKISELDERSVKFEEEVIDLCKLSETVAERLKAVADKRNITINVIGGSIKISGVGKILDEMIYNLMDNAIKYNKEGGMVDVIVTKADECVKLIVRDTGIGIPQADRPRVFERFYCVDKSRSKTVGGTGLGLSIVKHAAAYHNAQITLDSVVGIGTTVTVSFDEHNS